MIYFTIGNFYIINLVQVLQLLHISYRITLFLFTFVPFIVLVVKIYNIPVIPYLKRVAGECKHYALREVGFKTFIRHRFREIKVFLRVIFRNIKRLFKENYAVIPFIVFLISLIWGICGNGILNRWGYGASDLPVHNYWINGLIDNNIYVAGIYPMGMHCMLYYLTTLIGMPVYVSLRLFWFVQFAMIAIMLLIFLRCCCKNKFIPYIGAMMFVGAKFFVSASYLRYGATLPQEYGMMYILPSIVFLMKFFESRENELNNGFNLLRCKSTWYLFGFALSFSLTLTSHFYDTIIALIICVGVGVGYSRLFIRKEYFIRVMLAGILSFLMAFLPMAAAFLTGKSLQGSMYWAMNVIGLRDYTVLIFAVICLGVVSGTVFGVFFVFRGIKKGKISFENKKVPEYKTAKKIRLTVYSLIPVLLVIFIGWKYKKNILSACKQLAFALTDMNYVFYFAVLSVVIGLIYLLYVDKDRGSAIVSIVIAEILLALILISGSVGWPMLMEPGRVCIYFAYLIPAVFIMTIDGAISLLFLCRLPKVQQFAGLTVAATLLVLSLGFGWIRGSFGGGNLEMNETILCTANILKDNKGKNNTWTIISANDELRMIEKYGRHTETIEFLEDMEHWNRNKEVTIPTEKVYFYIEKEPINYAGGYAGKIPPVSEEQAEQDLPKNKGITAYSGVKRSVTMSRMYYWAQKFLELYPNEFKVYYENERFVCYYIEQNVFSLYNFAIDYGYNL
ncbi:MAG: hypothetical protein ACI3XA_01025 [Clostridia bacterium]